MQIISRAEAQALGLNRYFTGKPCKRGHIAIRYVHGGCIACAFARTKENQPRYRPKRRIWYKQWYLINRARLSKEKAALKQARRANAAGITGTFTPDDWLGLCSKSLCCHWCKRPFNGTRRPTHDHVVPLKTGGENTLENSVCACSECNSRKGARLINPTTGQGILL